MDRFSLLLLILLVFNGNCYLILASILATEFGDRDIKSYYYGIMLCAYPLAAILSCFSVPYLIQRIGRSNVLYAGAIFLSISMSLSGVMKYIKDNSMMVLYGIFTRTIQGTFKAFIQTSSFPILIIMNPNEKMKYIGYAECNLGLGNAIGPLIGAMIYSFFGFTWMFIVVGGMIIVFVPLLKCTMPPKVDDDETTQSLADSQDAEMETNLSPEKKISYYGMVTDPMILLVALTQVVISVGYQYYEPVLSFRLTNFTKSVRIQGLVFGSLVFGYSVMCFLTPMFANRINQINLLAGSVFMLGIFNFLIGPSTLLPDNIFLLIAGLFLSGGAIGVATIPLIPMMIERCDVKFPGQRRIASDMCTGIFTGTNSLGQLLGPVYGGYLYYLVGFRNLCDITAIMFLLFSIALFFLGHYYSNKPSNNVQNPPYITKDLVDSPGSTQRALERHGFEG